MRQRRIRAQINIEAAADRRKHFRECAIVEHELTARPRQRYLGIGGQDDRVTGDQIATLPRTQQRATTGAGARTVGERDDALFHSDFHRVHLAPRAHDEARPDIFGDGIARVNTKRTRRIVHHIEQTLAIKHDITCARPERR